MAVAQRARHRKGKPRNSIPASSTVSVEGTRFGTRSFSTFEAGLSCAQSQSGSVRDQLTELLALAANQRAAGGPTPSFQIDVGTFESVMDGMDLLDESRRLSDGLRRAGGRQAYLEVPEGHSWLSWRARIGQAIAFTLAGTASVTAP